MVTVAITGVGGLVGRRLAATLEEDPAVERMLGLDLRAPAGLTCSKLEFRHADVRDAGLHRILDGVDVLVHLAFQMDPIQDEATMRAVNVDGTRNVVQAAADARVGKVVYVSSGVVYGAHPDNDFPLHEDSPLRANPEFDYAQHKLDIERWLWPWAEDHPEVALTVLRPSVIFGPGVDNFMTRLIELPRFPMVSGHRPPMQFVHVDDVASALAHTVRNDLPGAYNLSSQGWLSFDEIMAVSRFRTLKVPEELAFAAAERAWRLGLTEAPPGLVHYLMHPWVMSVDKLVASGWEPAHSNRDALAATVDEHQGWVSVLNLRAQRSTVRNTAIGLGALGSTLLLRRLLGRDRS